MPLDPIGVALAVIDVLDSLGVPYVIGGSFASSTHGLARATQDIDIVAELRPEHADRFVAALRDRFYVDLESVHRAVRTRGSFNLIHLDELYKVDVFIPPDTTLGREQLRHRRRERVAEPDRQAFVLSAEDVVLQKLGWYRMGGERSERQWRDVLGVLKLQGGRLDTARLRAVAADAGLLDLLERAFLDADAPLA